MTVERAAKQILAEGVIIFPTETSYGIGCLASSEEAAERVLQLKGRPSGKPLPVLLPSSKSLHALNLETPLISLADAFWPGALTLIIPAYPGLAKAVTQGTNMVGVRVSAHPMAQALVQAVGAPIVATSANRTGEPAAFEIDQCADLEGVDGIIDGGRVPGGASTVVGLVEGRLEFYRQGPISEERICKVWRRARPYAEH